MALYQLSATPQHKVEKDQQRERERETKDRMEKEAITWLFNQHIGNGIDERYLQPWMTFEYSSIIQQLFWNHIRRIFTYNVCGENIFLARRALVFL